MINDQEYKKHLISVMHSITKSMTNLEELIESLPAEEEKGAQALEAQHAKYFAYFEEVRDRLIDLEQSKENNI